MIIRILMFIFPKFLLLMSLFGRFSPIIWISSNWLKFCKGVHSYILITVLMFVFSKLFWFIFLGKFGPKIWSSFKLTDIWYRGKLLNAYFDFNVYFFKLFLSFIHFWANLFLKCEVIQIDWNFIQEQIVICWLRFWCVIFQCVCC